MTYITVIVPTYNRGDLLETAISSVLEQTFSDLELIVVDDCSSDNTRDVVCKINDDRISYKKHGENKGVSAARNTGIKAASGEYIAFLDSDDYWLPTKLEEQVKAIEKTKCECQVAYCGCITETNNHLRRLVEELFPEPKGKSGGEELICDVLSQTLPIHPGSTLLLRRRLINEVGYFNEDLKRQEDLDFVASVLKKSDIIYVNKQLVKLRDTGRPDTKTLTESREVFIKNAIQHVKSIDEYDMLINSHRRQIANGYLRDGDFNRGFKLLRRSMFNSYRDYIATVYHAYRGIRSNVL